MVSLSPSAHGDPVRSRLLNSLFGNFEEQRSCRSHGKLLKSSRACFHKRDSSSSLPCFSSDVNPPIPMSSLELFNPLLSPNMTISMSIQVQDIDDEPHSGDNHEWFYDAGTDDSAIYYGDDEEKMEMEQDAYDDDDGEEEEESWDGFNNNEEHTSTMAHVDHRPGSKVSFFEKVKVVVIPSHRDYSEETRQRLWNSRRLRKQNMQRNYFEFKVDGGDWRTATEEDDFVRLPSGELVHPATLMREAHMFESHMFESNITTFACAQ